MIQDIGPHRLDRTYSLAPAGAEDLAVCCREGQVLLRRSGEGWALPRFREAPADRAGARHVLALDGVGCYLAEGPEEAPEGFAYVTERELRNVRPLEVAFAAITACQLRRWYRDRAFCGRCGGPTEPSTVERAMVCPRCGLIEYPKICPVIIVAVTDGDRLLLTRYADRPYKGEALVAGFVEVGETLEDTVRREVMEEVGLRVKNIRYYKSQPWAFTDTLLSGFYCQLDGDGTVTLDRTELKEGVWRRREELAPRGDEVSLTAEMIERFRLGKENEA